MSVGFASFIPTFTAVLSAIVASATIWGLLRPWYLKGWGSRRLWRGKLNCLVNWATDEYVRELLGTPVFISLLTTNRRPDSEGPKWVDRIYSTPHAWVVTRSIDNQIQGWSVTITDPKFWWGVEAPTFWNMKGRLGQATFADLITTKPSGCREERGARLYLYAESVYWGNPGAYQTYVFMYNNAGTGKLRPTGADVMATGALAAGSPAGVAEVADEDTRSGTTVNTLMVLPPNMPVGQRWDEWPIAHHDQVRMLYPEMIRRRRQHLSRSYLGRLRRS